MDGERILVQERSDLPVFAQALRDRKAGVEVVFTRELPGEGTNEIKATLLRAPKSELQAERRSDDDFEFVQGIESGRRAVISGFHDATGDPKINEELAKLRAQTVRDVLLGLGVSADKVDLQKPAISAGSGNNAEARRVEVKLLD